MQILRLYEILIDRQQGLWPPNFEHPIAEHY